MAIKFKLLTMCSCGTDTLRVGDLYDIDRRYYNICRVLRACVEKTCSKLNNTMCWLTVTLFSTDATRTNNSGNLKPV